MTVRSRRGASRARGEWAQILCKGCSFHDMPAGSTHSDPLEAVQRALASAYWTRIGCCAPRSTTLDRYMHRCCSKLEGADCASHVAESLNRSVVRTLCGLQPALGALSEGQRREAPTRTPCACGAAIEDRAVTSNQNRCFWQAGSPLGLDEFFVAAYSRAGTDQLSVLVLPT